jgi:CRP-like cAMP-binding protein
MGIDKDILLAWGGVQKKYLKHEIIFHEGEMPRFYYQLIEGEIKMYNYNDKEEKEFFQGIFKSGDSFGEPPLLIGEVYPATAENLKDSVVIKLSRESFMGILAEYEDIHLEFTKTIARRLYNKAISSRDIISNTPETRILRFLDWYKKRENCSDKLIEVEYTRQQIANFTGLRVETVIRAIQKLKLENKLEIRNRKIII